MKRFSIILLILGVFGANGFAQKQTDGDVLIEAGGNLNSIGPNFILPNLRARYFLSPTLGLRADFSFNNANITQNFIAAPDSVNIKGDYVTKISSFGIGLGVEKHWNGNSRFSPFWGGSLGFRTGKIGLTGTNAIDSGYVANHNETFDFNFSGITIAPFIGADYWINQSFYVGMELNLAYGMFKTGDATSISDGVKEIFPGGSVNGFGQGITPFIRVGYNLTGKNAGAMVDMDSDNDGVPDKDDKCPNTPKGVKVTKSGCSEVAETVMILAKNIYFETDSDVLKAESYESLDKVVKIMNDYPKSTLDIQGYTDNTGGADHNLDLSKRRAASVKAYLEGKGIAASRMTSNGFGEANPVATNNTAEGRALNRRVELHLTL
ncbi:MAG: OmpA family protein [Flavobacteriales bacterium]|nr:OmpA family protein [Flavobacteriales bacterium]